MPPTSSSPRRSPPGLLAFGPPPALLTLLLLATAGCGAWADDLLCEGPNCEFTVSEWKRVKGLANIGDPAPDPSNKYTDPLNARHDLAVNLGHRFYYDPAFAGPALWTDGLGRPVASGRAARCTTPGDPSTCERMKLSCASCHDPALAGSDFTSRPGHVSEGSGWYDVNAQQVLNVGHYEILYWNGRSDSVWSQAIAVMESDVSMNGNRLDIVRRVAESPSYRAEYDLVFPEYPLPQFLPAEQVKAMPRENGVYVCPGDASACPAGCVPRAGDATNRCWLQYPLRGKAGRWRGCQGGDPTHPEFADDAFDCMRDEDRETINRAFANIGKAIGAYEAMLASANAPFDQYVNGRTEALNASAVRGLKLFVGRASCIDCHKTALFSDSQFHNIGVPQQGISVPTERDCVNGVCPCKAAAPTSLTPEPALAPWESAACLPYGLYNGLAKLHKGTFRRDSRKFSDDPSYGAAYKARYYDVADSDITAAPEWTKGAWRTPSLRDVALTPPYMHDGVYRTLDEVVWHYDQGGTAEGVGTKAVELKPLLLTPQDRLDLVEFLKSLTGGHAPERDHLHKPPTTPPPP